MRFLGLIFFFVAMAGVSTLGGATVASATTRLMPVPTPIFVSELPVGWTATYYDQLRSVIVTPSLNDPAAPSLLVGLADQQATTLDPATMAAQLRSLVGDGGVFEVADDRWDPSGHLLMFQNQRKDLFAAVRLALFEDGSRPAMVVLVAPPAAFDALDAEALVRRVGGSVRVMEKRGDGRSSIASTRKVDERARMKAANLEASARTIEAASGAVVATTQSTAKRLSPDAVSKAAAMVADDDAVSRQRASLSQAVTAKTAAEREILPFLGRRLAAIEASPSLRRASGAQSLGPLLDIVLTLHEDGLATREDRDERIVHGVWRLQEDHIIVDWRASDYNVEGGATSREASWRLNVTEQGLGVQSTLLRPLLNISAEALVGRLTLIDPASAPLEARPNNAGAPIAVTRADFGHDGRFAVSGQSGRSDGGRYAIIGDTLTLMFWSGVEQTFDISALALDGATTVFSIDGRRFAHESLQQ